MPLINPEQSELEIRQELPAAGYYIVMTPIPVAILSAAWYFNPQSMSDEPGRDWRQNEMGPLRAFGIISSIRIFMVSQPNTTAHCG